MSSDHLPTGDMTAGEVPSDDGSHLGGGDPGSAVGDWVGPYRILVLVGQGGFGVVYLAERREPMVQRVALKVVKPGMDSRAVIARFEQERQALAVMDHPNVARVFDGGMTSAGRPYFAMEYVRGEAISAYCDRQRLGVRARLALFVQVCDAVQHAHTKGIIHRDLKPSNVLVAQPDDAPVVKVIDFGVAKAMSHGLPGAAVSTESGQMVGTREYMSPEQAEGGRVDIDTRSDVYSLGVMLYELLTGLLPFETSDLRGRGHAEVRRIIVESEPPRPSERLRAVDAESGARIASARQVGRERLTGELKRELEWIPLKAMRKDRARRYASAEGLASDIRRYLEGRPLEAAPESKTYLARKFLARNKAPATATALVAVSLIGGFGTALVQRNEAVRQQHRAEDHALRESNARRRAETIGQFVTSALRSGDPNNPGGSQATTILDAIGVAVRDIESGRFRDDPETEAGLRATIAMILLNNGRASDAAPLAEQALAARRRLHVDDHPDVAASMIDVARVWHALGRLVEAEPLVEQALAMSQRLFPGDHESVATGLNALAYVRETLGRSADAEPLFVRALEMRRRLHGRDHPEVAQGLNNLASVRESLGRTKEAEALYAEALAMCQRLHPGDHPDVALAKNNLGVARHLLGRPGDAEPLFAEALAMRQRLFRGDHPDVAQSLTNLAAVHEALGRSVDAEALYAQALAMGQRLARGDHPAVAMCMSNLASVQHSLGRTSEAESTLVAAIEMRRRLGQGDHPEVAQDLRSLATVREALGRLADAEPLYAAALAMAERVLPEDHPDLAEYRESLAACRAALASPPKATGSPP